MMMIPRVYQPQTPAAERAGEDFTPDPEAMARMGKFNEELFATGRLIALDGLHPIAKGARISFEGGSPTVTDGPFIESKEVLGGFWIVRMDSKEQAIEWARRVPAAPGDVIELREIFEMEDFPEEMRKAAEGSGIHAALKKNQP